MRLLGLLHHHPRHRRRQLRWVVPIVLLLAASTLAGLLIQYRISDQDVTAEFFRAHKSISHTGQLLERGTWIGGSLLVLLLGGIGAWTLHLSHRIIRPVHTLHRALEELTGGDLGVRVELHQSDEFREVAETLNHLVDEFSGTLTTVHSLVDRIAALTTADSVQVSTAAEVRTLVAELDRVMEFFRLEPRRTIRETDNV